MSPHEINWTERAARLSCRNQAFINGGFVDAISQCIFEDFNPSTQMGAIVDSGMTISVNTVDALDPMTPFGGFRQSGFGRDLSLHALDKFSQFKTTWINLA